MPTLTVTSNFSKPISNNMTLYSSPNTGSHLYGRSIGNAYSGITISNSGNTISNVQIEPILLISKTHINSSNSELNFHDIEQIHDLSSLKRGSLANGSSIEIKPLRTLDTNSELFLEELCLNYFLNDSLHKDGFIIDDSVVIIDSIARPQNFQQITGIDAIPYYELAIFRYQINEGTYSDYLSTSDNTYVPLDEVFNMEDYYSCDIYLLIKIEYDILLSDNTFAHKIQYFEGRSFEFFAISEEGIPEIYKSFLSPA